MVYGEEVAYEKYREKIAFATLQETVGKHLGGSNCCIVCIRYIVGEDVCTIGCCAKRNYKKFSLVSGDVDFAGDRGFEKCRSR